MKTPQQQANADFTSLDLRMSRAAAREFKIKIPKLSTWRDSASYNPYYEVHGDGRIIWQGPAYNASEAKARAIEKLIEQATQKAP